MHLELRGLPSLVRAEGPLYVVDGVPVSNAALFSVPREVVSPVNRAADLDTHDIEQVEILTGPVALAQYGVLGAGGVIRVTTRRGQPGSLQARVSQHVGLSQLSRKLGSRTYATVEEAVADHGEAARDFFVPGQVFDHEEQVAGRLGPSVKTHLRLSGGTERTRFFVSGLFENDTGIVAGTGRGKQGLRLGLDQEFSRVRFSATVHLLHARARRGYSPYEDLAYTPSFFDLSRREDGTFPSNPFISEGTNPLVMATFRSHEQDVWRVVGSAVLDATLWASGPHTLSLGVQGGLDRFDQEDGTAFPEPDPIAPSVVTVLRGDSEGRNLRGLLELRYQLRPASGGLVLRTEMGLSYDEQRTDSTLSVTTERRLAPDRPPTTNTLRDERQLGGPAAFLRANARLFEERLMLDALLRAERLNENEPFQYSTLAAVGYRIRVPVSFIDELVPQAVLGNGRGLPRLLLAQSTFPGGPPSLEPEQHRELALGVDAVALEGRVRLGGRAWWQQLTEIAGLSLGPVGDGPLIVTLEGSRIVSHGAEVALALIPVQTKQLQWTSRTLFGLSRTKVAELPGPAFLGGGFGNSLGAFRVEAGSSMTQIVGNDGLKPDGSCCEVRTIGDTAPDFRVSFQNELRLGGVSLWALVDWQQGGDGLNLLRFMRDLGRTSPDSEAGQERLVRQTTSARAYLEDTTFLKVREVALGYVLPESWLRGRIPGVQQVRLSTSVRDVLTFTRYSGLDPEVSDLGGGALVRNLDLAPFPPSRSFWASLDVGF